MRTSGGVDTARYLVVRDGTGTYSVWPATRDLPMGMQIIGTSGTRDECLDRVLQLAPSGADLGAYLVA